MGCCADSSTKRVRRLRERMVLMPVLTGRVVKQPTYHAQPAGTAHAVPLGDGGR
jgi:hypothetical protein